MERYVLFQKDWGVYLGGFLGLGFWSIIDPVGQDSACVFKVPADVHAHIGTWESKPPDDYQIVKVDTKDDCYATIAECVAAGLPAWDPEAPGLTEQQTQAN